MSSDLHPPGQTRKHGAIARALPDPEFCRHVAQKLFNMLLVVSPYCAEPRFLSQTQRKAKVWVDAMIAGLSHGDGNSDRGFMAALRAFLL
jgi:hypothetical protein